MRIRTVIIIIIIIKLMNACMQLNLLYECMFIIIARP